LEPDAVLGEVDSTSAVFARINGRFDGTRLETATSGASRRLNHNNSTDSREGHVRLNFSSARSSTAAVFVALALSFPVAGYAGQSTSTALNGTSIRIDNFGRVNANYYRGAQPKGRDYSDLAAIGVRTIINLTSDDANPHEKALSERAGMSYVHIPMTMHQPPTEAQVAEFLRVVNDPASQPVYVHCAGGRHRTGVMTAVYRMTEQRWTADQAFREMKQYHFGFDFLHSEFKAFVFRYHPDTRATTTAALTPGQPSREAQARPDPSKTTGSARPAAE
jgi:tyrosine-protein phosphatase SIW14